MAKRENNIRFTSLDEVNDFAVKEEKVLVVLSDTVLDVTTFSHYHPGGAGLISNYSGKNIEEQMKFHHPLTLTMANTMAIGSFKTQLTRFIDPHRALLPQVWNLSHQQYLKLVNSPHWLFVPTPRMFESDFMELFTSNKWYSIFFLPLMVTLTLFYRVLSTTREYTFLQCCQGLFLLLFGVFSFSLTEYILHRFVFHSQKHLFDNRIIRYLHFLLHGVHHMLPSDPGRLVFPPVLAIIVGLIGLQTVCNIICFQDPLYHALYWTGFLAGYLCYDVIHYSLHHVNTDSKGSYFHQLQKYHNQHHFGDEEKGYGVSSKFWDIIFNTQFTKKIKQ